MENAVIQIIGESWKGRSGLLMEEVDKAARRAKDILTLEDYYRYGHRKECLTRSLGEFGGSTLDAGEMASLLGHGDEKRLMKKGRFERVQKIHRELETISRSYRKSPPRGETVSIEQDARKILKQAEEHLNSMAKVFSLIRRANMENRARYNEDLHDPFFSRFDWCQMDDSEIGLCPPFVVWGESPGKGEQYLHKMLTLISDGKPLKIIFLQTGLQGVGPSSGRLAAFQNSMDIELLPLAFRGVYLLQTASVNSNLAANLSRGLSSPRPGVFFVFWKNPSDATCHARAEKALSSRACPHVVYDPDISADFVKRLDLSGNPQPDRVWPREKIGYLTAEGKKEELERDFTFADFAAKEGEFRDQFTPLAGDADEAKTVLLSDYLDLTAPERIGKTPCIYSVDAKKHLVKLVPSPSIVARTADRMHLWQSLQELAGIDNPYVRAAEKKIRSELSAEKDQSMKKLRAELEDRMKAREKEAVVDAMKNLAIRLTGLAGGAIDLESLVSGTVGVTGAPVEAGETAVSASAVKVPAEGAAPAVAGDRPWIESKLCTTCDECTTINKKIFAYDRDKKAVIKDPKGGPFQDIVKAAEKCSIKIIHPGKPLDPKEKDLDKWVKRAEKFQ